MVGVWVTWWILFGNIMKGVELHGGVLGYMVENVRLHGGECCVTWRMQKNPTPPLACKQFNPL